MRLFFFSAILTWKYEVNLVHIPPWQRLANERENYIFGSSRVAWKLLNVVNINKESDDFVIVIALLPHIIFIRLVSEWAKCYLKVLRLLSTLFSWKLNFPLSWSWSYSTEIFDNGSPCTDLSHEQTFECVAMPRIWNLFLLHSDLKLLSSFILFSLPHLTLRLSPGLMNHLLVILLLFSRCVHFAVCNAFERIKRIQGSCYIGTR